MYSFATKLTTQTIASKIFGISGSWLGNERNILRVCWQALEKWWRTETLSDGLRLKFQVKDIYWDVNFRTWQTDLHSSLASSNWDGFYTALSHNMARAPMHDWVMLPAVDAGIPLSAVSMVKSWPARRLICLFETHCSRTNTGFQVESVLSA